MDKEMKTIESNTKSTAEANMSWHGALIEDEHIELTIAMVDALDKVLRSVDISYCENSDNGTEYCWNCRIMASLNEIKAELNSL